MFFNLFNHSYKITVSLAIFFLIVSLITRIGLFWLVIDQIDIGFLELIRIFGMGFVFDLGSLLILICPLVVLISCWPNSWRYPKVYAILQIIYSLVFVFITLLVAIIEFVFWDEFNSRFDFHSVDYLEYPYEVVNYFNEYYSLFIYILAVFILVVIVLLIVKRIGIMKMIDPPNTTSKGRMLLLGSWFIISLFYLFVINNTMAETSWNRYNNELTKAGIYAFFSHFYFTEVPFEEEYMTINSTDALAHIEDIYRKPDIIIDQETNALYQSNENDKRPNVILICMESLSADYMSIFGNPKKLTPTLDSLADNGVFFTNMFATGTRTIRGLEAITLSKPPTPYRSMLKRTLKPNLGSINTAFQERGYSSHFFCGGDAYFDEMESFFSKIGFTIVHRDRGFGKKRDQHTKTINFGADEITFENSWGVSDEDVYRKVLKESDRQFHKGSSFFNFILSNSNHKPYTYPEGKIDLSPNGTRLGAVAYSDYALHQFMKTARTKPWYANTIFIFISDHCAVNGNQWAMDVQNYHIPAIIYNHPNLKPERIDKLCSQIDIMPTLFGSLHWKYDKFYFGKDIFKMEEDEERAFIGSYRKLGLMKEKKVLLLDQEKQSNLYQWNPKDNGLTKITLDTLLLKETISYYQLADSLFISH